MKIRLMSNYDVWQNLLRIIRNQEQYPKIQNEIQATKKTIIKDCFVKSKDTQYEKSINN